MRLRQFLSVLGVVALVAVIYSPSTIGLSASPGGDGGTAPTDTSASGTSMFLAYLHQAGYNVTVATDPGQVQTILESGQRLVYVLIGADTPLSTTTVGLIHADFGDGLLSALVAEGNSTNEAMTTDVFEAHATGHPIEDPASIYADKQVFNVDLDIPGEATTQGTVDIASPIVLENSSFLAPVAITSQSSYDLGDPAVGPRTVVAAGASAFGSRAVLVSDSGPFTNFLLNDTEGVGDRAFVAEMLNYVDPGRGTPVLLDASHYLAPKPPSPSVKAGVPIGPLVAYDLEQSFSGLNGFYASFPSEVSGFLRGFGLDVSPGFASALVAAVILLSVYGAVTRWFAPEKKGKDDQPQPRVERTIVAESQPRVDFLQTSRSKGGYVAALAQLYELLDSMVLTEFGSGISGVTEGALVARMGAEQAAKAKGLFLTLSKFHDYASGEKRFLFPPVLRWRALTARATRDAEDFLNTMGVTIEGGESLRGLKAGRLVTQGVRVRP